MAFRLQMGLEGETQIDRVLGLQISKAEDLTTPLEAAGDIILDRVQQNFDKRGQLFGGWKPRVRDAPWPLLEKTGDMRRGFDKAVTSNQVTVGNVDPKFPFHQSNKSRKKIPRRVMLMIDQTSAVAIVKAFQEWYFIKRGN